MPRACRLRLRLRLRLLAAALAAPLLLAACAQIPTSGPVRPGRGANGGHSQQPIQVFAQPPHKGWLPSQIVTGFLAAMASPARDHEVARAYLTPDIRDRWPTGHDPAVLVYAQDESFGLSIGRDNTVTVTATQTATIGQGGEYRPAATGKTLHAVFRLQRVGAQWRIGSLPGSLLLTASDVVNAYAPFDLFFFSPDDEVLVPDPVVLPTAEQRDWPQELVEGLLAGPTPALAGGVASAIPDDTRLVSAPVLDGRGTLTVGLGGQASKVTGAARDRMIAQLVATLIRVPGVSRVRVQTGDGPPQPLHGLSTTRGYEPASAVKHLRGYFMRDGRLLAVDTRSGTVEPLRGPFGEGDVRFRDPAISLDSTKAAAVSRGERVLYVGAVDTPGRATAVYRGTALSSPSWDRDGNLWVVDNRTSGPRLLLFKDGAGKPVKVPAPGLRGREVHDVRLAWDGVRVALVTSDEAGNKLLVGVLRRDGRSVRLSALRNVAPALADVDDAWWYDWRSLAAVGREQSDLLATYIVTADGLSISVAPTVSDVANVAAAPGQPLLVGDERNEMALSQPDEFNSIPLGHGNSPAYPG